MLQNGDFYQPLAAFTSGQEALAIESGFHYEIDVENFTHCIPPIPFVLWFILVLIVVREDNGSNSIQWGTRARLSGIFSFLPCRVTKVIFVRTIPTTRPRT